MKKILSFVLTMMLVLSVSMPAFAATIAGPATSGETLVKTTTTTAGGEDASNYTVTIPASQTYSWNTTSANDVSYYVTSQLPYGATLAISVSGSNKMIDKANAANTAYLPYTMTGNSAQTFGALNTNEKQSVSLTISGWSSAPIAVYSDTLTYSVTYNA